MKNSLFLIFLLFSVALSAQEALYNSGTIRIHNTGNIGIHTNFINNSAFDQQDGLVGFYGFGLATISGAFVPEFYELEIFKSSNVFLETSINVSNNLFFMDGDIETPRTQPLIHANLYQNVLVIGESNIAKVDGYVSVENEQNYTFPVGDSEFLRVLQINSESANATTKCAYFFEDPNAPSSFNTSFNTTIKDNEILAVSTREFWRLEGSVASTVLVSWDTRSSVLDLADDFYKLGLVGWSKAGNKWVQLSSIEPTGDEDNGFIESDSFVPDDYDIITIAGFAVPTRLIELDNYLVTPNGDGANDFLLIPELEESTSNRVRIFDRNGLKVFEKDNYTNEFNGFANTNNLVYKKEEGLPSGVYFYLVYMDDLKLEYQGFLYLSD